MQCKSKNKSQKRLQSAQSPTPEAKLVVLSHKALKKTENRSKKIPKADSAEEQKNVKNQNKRISQTNYFKKKHRLSC